MRPADIQPLLRRFVTATRSLRGCDATAYNRAMMTRVSTSYYMEMLDLGWPPSSAQLVLRQAFAGMFDSHLF